MVNKIILFLQEKMKKAERNKLIISRHKAGYSQEEIGKFYDLSQSAISLIIVNAKKGIKPIEKERRGAKSRLSETELEELKGLLSSPFEESFKYWNKWSVQKLIEDNFGVKYHENYVWKIMKKIGYSSQLPQKKDYRQDREKVEEFKKKKVVEIKKSKI